MEVDIQLFHARYQRQRIRCIWVALYQLQQYDLLQLIGMRGSKQVKTINGVSYRRHCSDPNPTIAQSHISTILTIYF